MVIKIILADDHKIMREGLRTLIEKQRGMKVIAEAEDGRMAVELARKLAPNIVIMDVGMPGLNGIEATRQITREIPGVRVIALSMHADKRFAAEMITAGASGYLLKNAAFEELVNAIHAVLAQRTYLSPQLVDIIMKNSGRFPKRELAVFSILSAREREVIQLMAEGKATRQIASILVVSVKTIESHRQHILKKLGMNSIAELTKYAIREGLTSLEG